MHLVRNLALTLILGLLFAAIAACGGDDDGAAPSGGLPDDPDAVEEASTPKDLGELISRTYIEMIDEVRPFVESRPEPAQLQPRLEGIKARYIETFVAYGRQREAMSESDRALVDSAALVYLSANGPTEVDWANEATADYEDSYPELGATLGEINILSQYAYFDLLRQQSPDEAARLGID
jgi:hypothetical protein